MITLLAVTNLSSLQALSPLVATAIIGATIGEWLGARNGIGQLITIALYQLKPGLLYASLISITIASTLSILILSLIEISLSCPPIVNKLILSIV